MSLIGMIDDYINKQKRQQAAASHPGVTESSSAWVEVINERQGRAPLVLGSRWMLEHIDELITLGVPMQPEVCHKCAQISVCLKRADRG